MIGTTRPKKLVEKYHAAGATNSSLVSLQMAEMRESIQLEHLTNAGTITASCGALHPTELREMKKIERARTLGVVRVVLGRADARAGEVRAWR